MSHGSVADMTNAETDWSRLNRVVEQMTTRLDTAQFEEDFQSIGHLAREAFISLGQAVYDRARHPSEDGVTPSATDAKRMLTAYVAAEMSGAANEEARRFARAAVIFADVVVHKRSASRIDAELVVAAIESVVKVIAILARRSTVAIQPWDGLLVDGRFFAWSGPALHQVADRPAVPTPAGVEDALRANSMTPRFGRIENLKNHLAKGRLQVFETDQRTWRRALLLAGDGEQVLLVSETQTPKGKPRITSKGWEGVNAANQTYQAYPSWRYHPTKPPVIVQNEAESDRLGDEWADTPAAFSEKD